MQESTLSPLNSTGQLWIKKEDEILTERLGDDQGGSPKETALGGLDEIVDESMETAPGKDRLRRQQLFGKVNCTNSLTEIEKVQKKGTKKH